MANNLKASLYKQDGLSAGRHDVKSKGLTASLCRQTDRQTATSAGLSLSAFLTGPHDPTLEYANR